MREWKLGIDDPYLLVIAADARLTNPIYADDQIWRLNLHGGEPRALALETTYGLRARLMRIFPEFRIGDRGVTDPSLFAKAPIIQYFFANYIATSFRPFSDLNVLAEFWVPESNMAAGRYQLSNHGAERLKTRLLLYSQLRPDQEGSVMTEVTINGATILAGKTGDIEPIVFLTGGAGVAAAAYPALEVQVELNPGETKSYIWVHAGLGDRKEGFAAARRLVDQPWDAETARLFQRNSTLVDVETGDEQWDIGLAFAQKVALNSFIGATNHLPHPSIVSSRTPDQGYSPNGDGRDYDHRWDGQNALQTYYSSIQIVHIAPELAKGLLRNFLSVQDPDGSIDWKPGLAGQRSNLRTVPLLAVLALHIYQHTEDLDFLAEVFEGLKAHFESWFDKASDHDQDGFPEWVHTMHSGNEDWPAFVRWRKWGQALDISKAETPDLAAYLTCECHALVKVADTLGHSSSELSERHAQLRKVANRGWSEDQAIFQPIDRDLHHVISGKLLGKGRGEFTREVGKEFDPPVRVLVKSKGGETQSHAIQVFIHGKGRTKRDRVERLTERRFQWFQGLGSTTTDKTYSYIDRIEVRGLPSDFRTELRTANFNQLDLSGLLPLWASIPDEDQGESIIRDSVMNTDRFWRSSGIPMSSASEKVYTKGDADGPALIGMHWNAMIGMGLVDYGFRQGATELLGKLVSTSVASLRQDKGFHEFYHADRLEGFGERDHLMGVPPLSLFMYILGLRLISPSKVVLRGDNPFPWPVRVGWRGLAIRWEGNQAVVTFPDGGQVTVEGPDAQVVEQLD
jgi:hypothetical protein